MLVFEERGKLKYPEEKLSEQGFLRRGENCSAQRKTSQSKERTKNKFTLTYGIDARI